MGDKKQIFTAPELSVEDLSMALYKANKELTLANEQLKNSEKKRLDILANLSHDLRSPIAVIKNDTEYLLSFNDLSKEDVNTVLHSVKSKILVLEHFIDEILAITSLDSTCEDVPLYDNIDIGIFLHNLFNDFTKDLRFKNCKLAIDLPANFTYYISMDTNLMHRALENLFLNALKYSNTNCCIKLSATYSENNIIICVADNGIGIKKSDLKKIFERTYMVSKARTPSSGFGLGLAIVESIIHKHGGKVWCESSLGVGSNFYFSLPLSR